MINNFRYAVYRDALRIVILILLCSIVYTGNAYCQAAEDTVIVLTADTTKVKTKKGSIFSGRPGKSLLMSLVVPGAGQIYNKSYLRVPFVWAAVGGMGYLVVINTQYYQCR